MMFDVTIPRTKRLFSPNINDVHMYHHITSALWQHACFLKFGVKSFEFDILSYVKLFSVTHTNLKLKRSNELDLHVRIYYQFTKNYTKTLNDVNSNKY